jgi:acetyltransferase-like isoleucine patch superfamily enzyme
MTIEIEDHGRNNKVAISRETLSTGHGRLVITGDDNVVEISAGTVLGGCNISMGDRCTLRIGESCYFNSTFLHAANDVSCIIGNAVSLNARVRFLAHEPGRIEIGSGSLFASDIDLTISDMHSIFDLETGVRINPARNVSIGENVWIGDRCLILKGAKIGSGSVIGACSVVTGEIEDHALAAGVPARTIRRGIAWDRRLMDHMGGAEAQR